MSQSRRVDETGNVYGKLTVLEFAFSKTVSKTKRGGRQDGGGRALAFWRCRCKCGRERIVVGRDLRRKDRRAVRTCGICPRITHGHTRTGYQSPTYVSWHSMMSRCTTPGYDGYEQYGGAGVKVCKRWLKFENFLVDMGERPSKRHTIDRRDGTKGYSPSNCRWATKAEQNRNMRTNVWVEINGKRRVLRDWLDHFNLDVSTYYGRIWAGLSPKEALTRPRQIGKYLVGINAKLITLNGETKTLAEWLEHFNLNRWTYYDRRQRGLSEAEALTTPVKKS